ncbi:MAG: hormogonium polysaccharide biosynthesis glycosyltransferase HpsE [Cyanobacteria bacterium P01_A01_bin.123]
MADFIVVICTYNGEQRLPAVIERLQSQAGTTDFTWQVVVIDNNSQDGTAAVVQRYQRQWPDFIRYEFEPRQGLAYARRRAMEVIDSAWVGFLDDDTFPDCHWVQAAYDFAREHPQVGAFGSRIRGQFEVTPPPNFQRIAACLAIIDRGDRPFQYAPTRGVLPAGAGMVIRADVWRQYVPEVPVLSGVCGTSLATKGEDVESLSYIRKAGYAIWYNPAMQLWHQIPKERLSRCYLKRLFQGIGLSRYPLRMLNYRPWQRPLMTLIHGVNDGRKLVKYVWGNWRSLLLHQDLVIESEWMLHWSSFVSPLYFLKTQLRAKRFGRLRQGQLNWRRSPSGP